MNEFKLKPASSLIVDVKHNRSALKKLATTDGIVFSQFKTKPTIENENDPSTDMNFQ